MSLRYLRSFLKVQLECLRLREKVRQRVYVIYVHFSRHVPQFKFFGKVQSMSLRNLRSFSKVLTWMSYSEDNGSTVSLRYPRSFFGTYISIQVFLKGSTSSLLYLHFSLRVILSTFWGWIYNKLYQFFCLDHSYTRYGGGGTHGFCNNIYIFFFLFWGEAWIFS